MKRIVLLTGNHLCHNPRVIKEAGTLSRAGFDVEVLGGWFDSSLKSRDVRLLAGAPFRFTPVIDVTSRDVPARMRRLGLRIRTKTGHLLHEMVGFENRWQLGYAASALSRSAWLRKADLFIAHSEAGLLVAGDLLNAGRNVGVDMEDWFSEDLLPQARKGRPIELLRRLERELLRRCAHASCPSYAMSAALARDYGCSPPAVIYNAFPWSDRDRMDGLLKDHGDDGALSVHWYSQTIGPGRGLEDLFAALPILTQRAELHLRGNPVAGFDEWLAASVPEEWRTRVFVHGLVSNDELLSRIAEHDIGFAGEMKYCRNRDLTVSNKVLQYMLGGLPVVASDTVGQHEVAQRGAEAVLLYPSGDATVLAQRLNALLNSPDKLRSAKATALRVANQVFCWERQEDVLLDTVRHALSV